MSEETQRPLTFAEIVSGTKRDSSSTSALIPEIDSNGNAHSRPSANGGRSPRPIVVNGSSGSGSRRPWDLAPIPAMCSGRKPTYPSRVTSDQTHQTLPDICESPVANTPSDATAASHDPSEEAQHVSPPLPSAVTHENFELQPTKATKAFETEWSAGPTPMDTVGGYMAPALWNAAPYMAGGPPQALSMPGWSFGTSDSLPSAAGGPVTGGYQSASTPSQRGARTSKDLADLSTEEIIGRVASRRAKHVVRRSDKYAYANCLADNETMSGLRSICAVLQEPDADNTIVEVAMRMCQQPLQTMSREEVEWFSRYWQPRFSAISAECSHGHNSKWADEQAYLGAKRAHMLVSLVQSRHSMRQATNAPSTRT